LKDEAQTAEAQRVRIEPLKKKPPTKKAGRGEEKKRMKAEC
jgi:hypothetical protein